MRFASAVHPILPLHCCCGLIQTAPVSYSPKLGGEPQELPVLAQGRISLRITARPPRLVGRARLAVGITRSTSRVLLNECPTRPTTAVPARFLSPIENCVATRDSLPNYHYAQCRRFLCRAVCTLVSAFHTHCACYDKAATHFIP